MIEIRLSSVESFYTARNSAGTIRLIKQAGFRYGSGLFDNLNKYGEIYSVTKNQDKTPATQ